MASSKNMTSKYQKFANEDVDLLNDVLPEHVVSNILSRLPTKEAVKTSILSKRWRFLWTTIYNLDFSDHNEVNRSYMTDDGLYVDKLNRCGVNRKKFIKYVSSVLLRLDPTNSIHKLSIFLMVYPNVLEIKKWISCAEQLNVKDLTLSLATQTCYNRIEVPRKVFDCKSLESLWLYVGLNLKIPKRGFVCFPNLKFLSLEYVSISGIPAAENSPCFPKLMTLCLKRVKYEQKDDCVMKLIRNCPLLKDLTIHKVLEHNVSNVDMCIPQLTTVDLGCGYYGKIVGLNVQIEAPIRNLAVSLWNPTHKIIVKNPVSLIRAEIRSEGSEAYHFSMEEQGEVLKLLETVGKVKYLSLGQAVIHAIQVSKVKLPLFSNLIRLEVFLNCEDLCMLESFLDSAINLQNLVVNKNFKKCRIGEDRQCVGDDVQWTELSHVPKCMISSLKTVEINDAIDCPDELDMIKIMLKSAQVLEKLTTYRYIMNDRNTDSLRQKISAFPRASALCQFDFEP
jgi:hypothetical protein